MYYVLNRTCIGYSHLKNKKPCQDFSSSYQDNERIIITCCDGHGGNQYVRSRIGSRLAGESVNSVFKSLNSYFFQEEDKVLEDKIRLLILCEYNKLVEREIAARPIRKRELVNLTEEEVDAIRFNPAKAYGTTLSGAIIYKKKLVIVSIGDTEALGIKKGELIKIFDNSDDPAGNVTYSMCQEDAYKYLRVKIMDENDLDAILLCTDGLSSPYQNYRNFNNSFIKPMMFNLLKTKSMSEISSLVEDIGLHRGVGDDVSLAFIINDKAKAKYYKNKGE